MDIFTVNQIEFLRLRTVLFFSNSRLIFLLSVTAFIDDFRLFAGDLGNEVTDELLTKTFSKYPSFLKAKVVRDKRTQKSKGYGFISFAEPDDFARAWKEMNGKTDVSC